jgi:hypothetical protein
MADLERSRNAPSISICKTQQAFVRSLARSFIHLGGSALARPAELQICPDSIWRDFSLRSAVAEAAVAVADRIWLHMLAAGCCVEGFLIYKPLLILLSGQGNFIFTLFMRKTF